MALGALIGAYQEDDSGGLRALLPLAGRTLIEYQARCAAAAGAAPVVVVVERIPASLNDAFDRLRSEGVNLIPVSDGSEAASRFEPGALILMIADGCAPDMPLVSRIASAEEPAIATVPDDEAHAEFERLDATSRWAGVALVDGQTLGATAAMLGDWDLQSTLLRRTVQAGAIHVRVGDNPLASPLLATRPEETAGFERRLLVASRGARRDWVSRYILPIVEEFATERLMETRVRPEWLIAAGLAFTLAAAFAFTRGWLWPALGLLILASPLDLVADRLATLRMRPLPAQSLLRRALWPAAGLALIALGWWSARHGGGWGAMVAALSAAAFAQAARIERSNDHHSFEIWLFSIRTAVFGAIPFAIAGWWNAALAGLALYAAGSFFVVQHVRHKIAPPADNTHN
jgi:hypothetical protein